MGLGIFEKWLDVMPDKTYPNNTLVLRLLEILTKMEVSSEHLSTNDCYAVLQFYLRENVGNLQTRTLARTISAKWDRVKYARESNESEHNYKTFTKHVKGAVGMASEVQRKQRIGVVLPQRNAFDFVVAPKSSLAIDGNGTHQQKQDSGPKQDIMKTL